MRNQAQSSFCSASVAYLERLWVAIKSYDDGTLPTHAVWARGNAHLGSVRRSTGCTADILFARHYSISQKKMVSERNEPRDDCQMNDVMDRP